MWGRISTTEFNTKILFGKMQKSGSQEGGRAGKANECAGRGRSEGKRCRSDLWEVERIADFGKRKVTEGEKEMKSYVIVDTPKRCEDCKLCVAVLGKHYCTPLGVHIRKGEKDCNCPLVAVPEKTKG